MEETARVFTSKPAQRAAVNVMLLVSSAVTLLGLASLATALFFQNFVPDQFITTPIHLQYHSGVNPYGLAPFAYPSPKLNQDYDVSIALSMPRSPPNTDRGNFMVSLYLIRDDSSSNESKAGGQQTVNVRQYLANKKILFKSRRPALMQYEDPIIGLAKRILFVGYYILSPRSQRRTLTIQLAERINFQKTGLQPTAAFVEIEAGQDIHIYKTSLTLTAKLRGLRWLMFHYRAITYVAFTTLFWACEVLFMCLAWTIWSSATASKQAGGKGDSYTDSDYYDTADYDDQSDRQKSSVSRGKTATLKGEPRVKLEEEDMPESTVSDVPIGGGDTDDEDDFDNEGSESARRRRDFAQGTSYKGEGGDSIRRRAVRNLAT